MTGRDIGGAEPADLELPGDDVIVLAEYLAGVLEGTPAAAETAKRIRDEPVWGQASRALARSTSEVTATLAAWGLRDEPMPADVVERISTALAQAGTGPHPADELATGGTAGSTGAESTAGSTGADSAEGGKAAGPDRESGAGTRRPGTGTRPGTSTRPGRTGGFSTAPGVGRGRPRAWLAHRAGPVAVVASVLAFCGLGMWVVPLIGGDQQRSSGSGVSAPEMLDSDDGAAVRGPEAAAEPGGLARLPVGRLLTSGVDYHRDTIGIAARDTASTPAAGQDAAKPQLNGRSVGPALDTAPTQLHRLTAGSALTACLAAIGAAHPHPAVTVQVVDFASFEGSPALVVLFVDSTGAQWAWAAGPGCGLPGVGADTRYRAKVG